MIDDDFNSLLLLSMDAEGSGKRDKGTYQLWMGLETELSQAPALRQKVANRIVMEFSSIQNAKIMGSAAADHVVVSDRFSSLFMQQLSSGETTYNVILDLLTTASDMDFFAMDNQSKDYDLLSIPVEQFFCSDTCQKFKNKRDCILYVFTNTAKQFIPIGYVYNGNTYQFLDNGGGWVQHVQTGNLTLDDDILFSKKDIILYRNGEEQAIDSTQTVQNGEGLILFPEGFLIVIRTNQH